MNVLSKQYSLMDTVMLRVIEPRKDLRRKGSRCQSNMNKVHAKLFEICRNNPNMTFTEFEIYIGGKEDALLIG